MARPEAKAVQGETTPQPSSRSRRVTLPLEPIDAVRGHGKASGSVEDLIAALGPANLQVAESIPHYRPLGDGPLSGPDGELMTLYYGTGVGKASAIAEGDTSGIGAGPSGYFGAGIYLAGDTYTALRVAESACEREGLYGPDAVHRPPVPIHLFAMRTSVGRPCDLKAEAAVLRRWAWQSFGIYEPDQVMRLIPEFLRAHGYDTGVVRSEAGPEQDYWIIPDRNRLTLIEHSVLIPNRNLVGSRHQPPGFPVRLEAVLAQIPLDSAAFDPAPLSAEKAERLEHWRQERASVSPKDAYRLEAEQRQEVGRWIAGRLPDSAPAFSRLCLMVEGLKVEGSRRTGMAPERWQGLYQRVMTSGEWDSDIVPRVIELVLLRPERYGSVHEALYWAVRQYIRRSGW